MLKKNTYLSSKLTKSSRFRHNGFFERGERDALYKNVWQRNSKTPSNCKRTNVKDTNISVGTNVQRNITALILC